GVLALRMEEVLLGVLVGAEGDDVEHAGFGDLPDAGLGGLGGGEAEGVAQEGEGVLPGEAVAEGFGVRPPPGGRVVPAQVADDRLDRLRAVAAALQPAPGPGPGDAGGGAPGGG